MSFLLPLGLLVGLFVVFPLLAHALRRGQARPQEFPATALVPSRTTTARQRHRLEDRLLLLLRILLLCCLALLAASPFVSCARLSLSRTDGASVAAALVIDDSASMQAITVNGKTRLEEAIEGAHQLLDTAQSGDTFSVVLAGHPARILSSTTTDLSSVRDALGTITPSDRRTDLLTALELARTLQKDVPQGDRPIVVLSDFSTEDAKNLDLAGVVVPRPELRRPLENCAIVSAVRAPEAVQAEVACTSELALRGRKVQLFGAADEPIGTPVDAKDGAVRLPLPKPTAKKGATPLKVANVRLTRAPDGTDHIASDDGCTVMDSPAALLVGVRADQEKAGMKTGVGTVIQAGIEALDRGVRVKNLSVLPEEKEDLAPLGTLVIDDPSGFSPEVRDALAHFAEDGGVALLFLGPAIAQAPLGSDFSPFLEGSLSWSRTESSGVDAKKSSALGPLAATWTDLGARSRATFTDDRSRVLVRFTDGQPLVIERPVGRGLLLAVSLPASVDESDLALRPAFLELLDYAIGQSAVRRGAQATLVGERWNVDASVKVTGPDGTELVRHAGLPDPSARGSADEDRRPDGEYVEPDRAGTYVFSQRDGKDTSVSTRVAMRDLAEQVTQPSQKLVDWTAQGQQASRARVGISREIALLALLLGALELAFRAVSRLRRRSPLQTAVS